MRRTVLLLAIAFALAGLSLMRVWPQHSMFGTARVNTLEKLGGCWQGDVRLCDLDPFDG